MSVFIVVLVYFENVVEDRIVTVKVEDEVSVKVRILNNNGLPLGNHLREESHKQNDCSGAADCQGIFTQHLRGELFVHTIAQS